MLKIIDLDRQEVNGLKGHSSIRGSTVPRLLVKRAQAAMLVQSVRTLACGKLGVRIQFATSLSLKTGRDSSTVNRSATGVSGTCPLR